MTVEELNELVPEDQRGDFAKLLDTVKASGNPLAGVDETNVDAFVEKQPVLKSARDRFHAKGLDTWQKNNVDKIYAERYAKEHPEETESDKRIKALEIANAEATRRAIRAENSGIAQKVMTERGLPLDLMGYVIGDDEESTLGNVEKIATALDTFKTSVEEKVRKEILNQYGREPEAPTTDPGGKFLTEEQILAMSPRERDEKRDLVDESIRHLEDINKR